VGVGFDTKGAGTIVVKGVREDKPPERFVIPDSREGSFDLISLINTCKDGWIL
jgi:hypothetical protein